MVLAAQLRALFDVPAAVAVADAQTVLESLVGAELRCVGPRWSEKRRWEYRAGRHCARQALRALGAAPGLLETGVEKDEHGAPRWPNGFVGSITHTGQGNTRTAACVVSRDIEALGLDMELDNPLAPELQQRVLTHEELLAARQRCTTERELSHHALMVFSAKEAFYKCQFPLTGTFLSFHDVQVHFGPEAGTFDVSCERLRGTPAAKPTRGRFTREDGFVLTAVFTQLAARL